MSVIAYASANSDVINNPLENAVIDLSTDALPASVNLFGFAEDTTDPNATFTWNWTLLDGNATLSATDTQNITVSNINTWHNIRLHLTAISSTGTSSEQNVLLSPSSSFVVVEVQSINAGIQKPATGQRNWSEAVEVWADKIEEFAGSITNVGAGNPNLRLDQLTDISSSVGAQVDQLTGGGVAVFDTAVLHTHEGTHVPLATTTSQGTVLLEEALPSSAQPKMITRERLVYTMSADGSHGTTVDQTGKIFSYASSDFIEINTGIPAGAKYFPQVLFKAEENIQIEMMDVTLYGAEAGVTYGIMFARYEDIDAVTNFNWLETDPERTATSQGFQSPMSIRHSEGDLVSAGEYFAPLIVTLDNTTDNRAPARRMLVSIYAHRVVS